MFACVDDDIVVAKGSRLLHAIACSLLYAEEGANVRYKQSTAGCSFVTKRYQVRPYDTPPEHKCTNRPI